MPEYALGIEVTARYPALMPQYRLSKIGARNRWPHFIQLNVKERPKAVSR